MAESIMVKMAAGEKTTQAAIDSAHELCIPMLTSSLTTAAVFLPIFLAESSTGEYTAPLFKVVTITVNIYFPLSFLSYDIPSLFAGKLHALLSRKYTKGRDFFDLGWYLSRWKDIVLPEYS